MAPASDPVTRGRGAAPASGRRRRSGAGDGVRSAATEPLALVIGEACVEVVRALALAGIHSAVVEPRGDDASRSRFARRLFDWDWGRPVDPTEEEHLLERLLDFGSRQEQPPVLFFCSDEAVRFTSRRREQLAPVFRFSVASPDLVADLSDKDRFSALSERLGLPVPTTRIVGSARALAVGSSDPGTFPVVVKPAMRGSTWSSLETAKAVRVDSPEELAALGQRWAGWDEPLVVQSCVPGPESAIESYHVYVRADGAVRSEFTGRKIRTVPADYGHSTAVALTGADDVRALGRELVDRMGLRGVAKFDFKRSPEGRLHLLEVNPRYSIWHHLGARAGMNIPAMVYADLTGGEYVGRPSHRATSATWVHPKDVVAARRAGMPLWRWAWWAARCDATAYWAWDDPLPFAGAVGAELRARLPHRGRGRSGS